MTQRKQYKLNVPDGWHRMNKFCYPLDGSKAYKSNTTDANIHVVKLADGAWNVNAEDNTGEILDELIYDYWDALAMARGWMLMHD